MGYYTAVFRQRVGESGHVIAFEGSSKNYRQVGDVPRLNCWSNVEVLHRAVGPDHQEIQFAGGVGGSSGPWGLGKKFSQRIRESDIEVVQSCGVDELVYELGVPASDFIKFDLEGAEVWALRNGPRLFREKRPILFLELHGRNAVETAGGFLEDFRYIAVVVHLLPKSADVSLGAWDRALRELAVSDRAGLEKIGYIPHMLFCLPIESLSALPAGAAAS